MLKKYIETEKSQFDKLLLSGNHKAIESGDRDAMKKSFKRQAAVSDALKELSSDEPCRWIG